MSQHDDAITFLPHSFPHPECPFESLMKLPRIDSKRSDAYSNRHSFGESCSRRKHWKYLRCGEFEKKRRNFKKLWSQRRAAKESRTKIKTVKHFSWKLGEKLSEIIHWLIMPTSLYLLQNTKSIQPLSDDESLKGREAKRDVNGLIRAQRIKVCRTNRPWSNLSLLSVSDLMSLNLVVMSVPMASPCSRLLLTGATLFNLTSHISTFSASRMLSVCLSRYLIVN